MIFVFLSVFVLRCVMGGPEVCKSAGRFGKQLKKKKSSEGRVGLGKNQNHRWRDKHGRDLFKVKTGESQEELVENSSEIQVRGTKQSIRRGGKKNVKI